MVNYYEVQWFIRIKVKECLHYWFNCSLIVCIVKTVLQITWSLCHRGIFMQGMIRKVSKKVSVLVWLSRNRVKLTDSQPLYLLTNVEMAFTPAKLSRLVIQTLNSLTCTFLYTVWPTFSSPVFTSDGQYLTRGLVHLCHGLWCLAYSECTHLLPMVVLKDNSLIKTVQAWI